jgi:ABC-type multidrug transport system ATPase subunit
MIEALQIRKAFGRVIALRELSFVAPDACITGLLGPNGAGKTTLLETLAGIRLPSRGELLLEGRVLSSFSTTQRAAYFALSGRAGAGGH